MWPKTICYLTLTRQYLGIHTKNEHRRGNPSEKAIRALNWTHNIHGKERNKENGD